MSMSNQEAIEIIELARAQIEWDYPIDYAVAFDMAISAIKAQDLQQKLQPTCNQLATDTISRKTAIDALCRRCDLVAEDDEPCTEKCNDIKILEKLPSAQPEQTEMIKEIRKWINSANRGNADYFIVDKIEEIINRYE